jgi:MATE family multidrug resistance protein
MAGQHGTETLAAFGIATQILIPVLIVSMGFFFSINAIVANHFGSNEHEKIGNVIKTCWIISIFSGGLCILLLNNVDILLDAFSVDPTLYAGVKGYFATVSFGIIPYFFFLVLRFTCEGLLKAKYVMYCAVSAIPIKVALNSVFVYGAFGIEGAGAQGMGIATSVTWTFMLVRLIALYWFKGLFKQVRFFDIPFAFDRKVAIEVIKVGAPIGLSMGSGVIFMSITGMLIGGISAQAMAAHQSTYNFTFFMAMLFQGLSVATTSRVAYLNGAGLTDEVKNVIKIALGIALAIALINYSVIRFFAADIGYIYSQDEDLIARITLLLFWGAIMQAPQALQEITSGILRGFKKTLAPTVIYMVSFGTSLMLGYYAATSMLMEERGYWLGLLVGYSMATLGMFVVLWLFFSKSNLGQKQPDLLAK